nr:PREDICTED: uncharacterized protein LOC106706601 [Latimeria chalumnae]|eukprot:XP_014353255.1 PREDICTED: uncharacterized protein LOC106706601 [Latimeria chalumnae]
MLTKPKLDACEQRWVAKPTAYDFNIKHPPGIKNVVADALSMEPFVKTKIGHRLLKEPYGALLEEAEDLQEAVVQDAFWWTNQQQMVFQTNKSISEQSEESLLGSLSNEEVASLLQQQIEWEACTEARSVKLIHHIQQVVPPGQTTLPVFTLQELQDKQQQDEAITRVSFFIWKGKGDPPERNDTMRQSKF